MAARRASALSKPGPRKVSNSPSIESQQHATRRNRGIARGRTPEVGLDDAYSTADAEEAVLKQAQLASELEAIRSRVAAADQIVAEAPTVDFGHLRSQFSAVRDEVESIDKVERDSLRASIGTWFTSKVSAVVEDDLLSDEEEDQADAIQHSSDTLAQLSKSSAPASVQRFKMALEKLKRVKLSGEHSFAGIAFAALAAKDELSFAPSESSGNGGEAGEERKDDYYKLSAESSAMRQEIVQLRKQLQDSQVQTQAANDRNRLLEDHITRLKNTVSAKDEDLKLVQQQALARNAQTSEAVKAVGDAQKKELQLKVVELEKALKAANAKVADVEKCKASESSVSEFRGLVLSCLESYFGTLAQSFAPLSDIASRAAAPDVLKLSFPASFSPPWVTQLSAGLSPDDSGGSMINFKRQLNSGVETLIRDVEAQLTHLNRALEDVSSELEKTKTALAAAVPKAQTQGKQVGKPKSKEKEKDKDKEIAPPSPPPPPPAPCTNCAQLTLALAEERKRSEAQVATMKAKPVKLTDAAHVSDMHAVVVAASDNVKPAPKASVKRSQTPSVAAPTPAPSNSGVVKPTQAAVKSKRESIGKVLAPIKNSSSLPVPPSPVSPVQSQSRRSSVTLDSATQQASAHIFAVNSVPLLHMIDVGVQVDFRPLTPVVVIPSKLPVDTIPVTSTLPLISSRRSLPADPPSLLVEPSYPQRSAVEPDLISRANDVITPISPSTRVYVNPPGSARLLESPDSCSQPVLLVSKLEGKQVDRVDSPFSSDRLRGQTVSKAQPTFGEFLPSGSRGDGLQVLNRVMELQRPMRITGKALNDGFVTVSDPVPTSRQEAVSDAKLISMGFARLSASASSAPIPPVPQTVTANPPSVPVTVSTADPIYPSTKFVPLTVSVSSNKLTTEVVTSATSSDTVNSVFTEFLTVAHRVKDIRQAAADLPTLDDLRSCSPEQVSVLASRIGRAILAMLCDDCDGVGDNQEQQQRQCGTPPLPYLGASGEPPSGFTPITSHTINGVKKTLFRSAFQAPQAVTASKSGPDRRSIGPSPMLLQSVVRASDSSPVVTYPSKRSSLPALVDPMPPVGDANNTMELADRLAKRNRDISCHVANLHAQVAQLEHRLRWLNVQVEQETSLSILEQQNAEISAVRFKMSVIQRDIVDLEEERELNFTQLMNTFSRMDKLTKSVFGGELYNVLLDSMAVSSAQPLPMVFGTQVGVPKPVGGEGRASPALTRPKGKVITSKHTLVSLAPKPEGFTGSSHVTLSVRATRSDPCNAQPAEVSLPTLS